MVLRGHHITAYYANVPKPCASPATDEPKRFSISIDLLGTRLFAVDIAALHKLRADAVRRVLVRGRGTARERGASETDGAAELTRAARSNSPPDQPFLIRYDSIFAQWVSDRQLGSSLEAILESSEAYRSGLLALLDRFYD